MPYTRSQANLAKRQRTASVAKCIPTVLLTNILEMKHEREVAEWREEHKKQFAPMVTDLFCLFGDSDSDSDSEFDSVLGWMAHFNSLIDSGTGYATPASQFDIHSPAYDSDDGYSESD
jgi:hypothetical protein